MKIISLLLASLLLVGIASCQEVRNIKVTVTEEDGTPIEGADATITFLGYSGRQTQRLKGKTDSSGMFQASGSSQLRMYVKLEKNGYYATNSDRLSRKQDHDLNFVLRSIKKPIPLYAKTFRGNLPTLGDKHGFDFQVGDWIAPYGDGLISDVFFCAKIEEHQTENGKLIGSIQISFPHKSEGVATIDKKSGFMSSSLLIMPHQAPEENYFPEISRKEAGYENKSKPAETSYFFRTRSKEIEPEKFVFNYTKFQDGFKFVMGGGVFLEEPYRKKHPNEYGNIEFTYYFNPTPRDRNLEFDPEKNLFTNLESNEQVREP